MAYIVRTTEELKWPSLKEAFFIGTRIGEELMRDKNGKIVMVDGEPKTHKVGKFINELQKAIDDGILDKMVKEAADQFHGGDIQGVLYAMTRNLDSQRSNSKKRDYAPNKTVDEIRLNTLVSFVNARKTGRTRSIGDLPQWAYGPEQIDQISDLHRLQAVINSINDACCNKAHGTYAVHLGPNFVEVAKANREYASKRKAFLKSNANQVSAELMAKLAKGSKVTLSAAQAAQLADLLKK